MNQEQPPNRKDEYKSPPAFDQLKFFTMPDLLKQPFLHELRSVINAGFSVHEEGNFKKTGERLTTDTQIATEVGENGFTGIAWSQNEIVGTASVKR
ncbi:uncharacterized protein N7484_011261 [Penicillium longicatenatum]|uniref:uncharacterized protein n=1 Tax=Penicillium longicatenatum TaxID=1561947 RepID=UPI002547CF9C|nr:uncharacterized protein N7484_011261 [Penicillium longicatenatum]KAJ5631161.1 hypothetical protein N7484_011261 [Penicillium longicatenatum]